MQCCAAKRHHVWVAEKVAGNVAKHCWKHSNALRKHTVLVTQTPLEMQRRVDKTHIILLAQKSLKSQQCVAKTNAILVVKKAAGNVAKHCWKCSDVWLKHTLFSWHKHCWKSSHVPLKSHWKSSNVSLKQTVLMAQKLLEKLQNTTENSVLCCWKTPCLGGTNAAGNATVCR